MTAALIDYLAGRLREVQQRLGLEAAVPADAPFAELVDSMGLVEFVGAVAADCDIAAERIEQAVGRRFTNLADLARALAAAGIAPRSAVRSVAGGSGSAAGLGWLGCVRLALPAAVQHAEQLDDLLGRPAGWLRQHAGTTARRTWAEQDALEETARAARACLEAAGLSAADLAALLVTSEAPPVPLGLAAALHARLALPADVPALEVGGACTGFLHCLWLGRHLVRSGPAVLLVAVEAPSRWLAVGPGPNEAAALFGDAGAACLLTAAPAAGAWPVRDMVLGCDGAAGELVRLRTGEAGLALEMDGPALALRAVQQLALAAGQVCARNGLAAADLQAVLVHAGNARLPALLARQLGVPLERIHATTSWTGNLGSVSLPAALAHHPPAGPAVCAAVGAGLCWGAALLGGPWEQTARSAPTAPVTATG